MDSKCSWIWKMSMDSKDMPEIGNYSGIWKCIYEFINLGVFLKKFTKYSEFWKASRNFKNAPELKKKNKLHTKA